jgi:hypothetical protein
MFRNAPALARLLPSGAACIEPNPPRLRDETARGRISSAEARRWTSDAAERARRAVD